MSLAVSSRRDANVLSVGSIFLVLSTSTGLSPVSIIFSRARAISGETSFEPLLRRDDPSNDPFSCEAEDPLAFDVAVPVPEALSELEGAPDVAEPLVLSRTLDVGPLLTGAATASGTVSIRTPLAGEGVPATAVRTQTENNVAQTAANRSFIRSWVVRAITTPDRRLDQAF